MEEDQTDIRFDADLRRTSDDWPDKASTQLLARSWQPAQTRADAEMLALALGPFLLIRIKKSRPHLSDLLLGRSRLSIQVIGERAEVCRFTELMQKSCSIRVIGKNYSD